MTLRQRAVYDSNGGQDYTSGASVNPSYRTALKPEDGMGYELALEHKFNQQHSSKATAFYQSVDNFIQFQHVFPFYSYNINHVNLWGLELEHRWQVDKKNSLTLAYTHQRTEKAGQAAVDNKGWFPAVGCIFTIAGFQAVAWFENNQCYFVQGQKRAI